MNRHPALSLDLDDGIDRKVLGQLRQRFLAVNAGRLQRARQALSSRQERVLRLLPLLFHINHPLLPGYLSASTPAGLSGFEADDEVLAEAQRLARSFVYKPRRQEPAQQPIHGLFLMGSLGAWPGRNRAISTSGSAMPQNWSPARARSCAASAR